MESHLREMTQVLVNMKGTMHKNQVKHLLTYNLVQLKCSEIERIKN